MTKFFKKLSQILFALMMGLFFFTGMLTGIFLIAREFFVTGTLFMATTAVIFIMYIESLKNQF